MNQVRNLPLVDVTSLVTDGKHGDCKNEESSGYYFLSSKDLRGGRLHYDKPRQINYKEFLETHRRTNLEAGDILLANTGASIGRVGIAQNDPRVPYTTFQKSISVIKADESIVDNRYLYYFILDNSDLLIRISGGAAQPNLLLSDLRKIQVRVPEKSEQKKISEILTSYDNLIENNNRRIAILEDMAQSLYQEWFVKFRFPGYQDCKFKESSLGLIPEGWKVVNLNEVSENFDRMRKPLSKMQRAERQGIYPYYGAAKIFDYVDDYIFDGLFLLLAEDGSVITPNRKPVLQLVNGKFWPNNHTHILQANNGFNTEFLYVALAQIDVSPFVTGAAQPKINQTNMNRIKIIKADNDTQKLANEIFKEIYKQYFVLEKKNKNLKKQRNLLLPKLISGSIIIGD